ATLSPTRANSGASTEALSFGAPHSCGKERLPSQCGHVGRRCSSFFVARGAELEWMPLDGGDVFDFLGAIKVAVDVVKGVGPTVARWVGSSSIPRRTLVVLPR